MNFQIIKTLFVKHNRKIAIVRINGIKGILKKFDITSKKKTIQFNTEKNILLKNTWSFVPNIIEHGNDYFITEYIDSKPNHPNDFQRNMTDENSNELVDKLFIINISKPIDGIIKREWLIISIAKVFYKLLPGGIKFSTACKSSFLLFKYWILSYKCFRKNVRTKGDFTELNVLLNESFHFIDFAAFKNRGFIFEDATYMALHQDKPMDELIWQKLFLKKYYSKIKNEFQLVNERYLSFWLIYSSLILLSVRFEQNVRTNFQNSDLMNELREKKQHVEFLLDKKNRKKYTTSIVG